MRLRPEVADILSIAVLRLLREGWVAGLSAPGGPDPAHSETLLSPPHRASMSRPGGAQKPPAKEDEHG
jgi:hypothetical protein